ncbi:NAD(P)H-binding protein [Kitasatospora sp. NBC_00315]|uniref:NAD(P)H-binding protein n=1 Tax=Kitasatospora sp. NBC_00315 TaxID=2975963 RepID=UPI00324AEA06
MILLTGATGAVGRLLADSLLGRGAAVRAVTRAPATAALPAGVRVVEGDAALRPDLLGDALAGVDAIFLHPRVAGDRAAELLALARERGVRRVVALAAMNIDDPLDEQPSRAAGDRNRECEEVAVASGLEWTSLRPSSFAGNTARAWGGQLRAGDVVRYPFGAFQESLVDERDIAEVAAHALLGKLPSGRRLELTGPRSLSHRETVAVLGGVLGRELRFEEIPAGAAADAMIRAGMPAPFVQALMARYARHLDRPQHPATGVVQEILGRPARGYDAWAADHADAFGG